MSSGNYKKVISFKAGRLNFNKETKKVQPDTRKGLVRVFHDLSDEKHFTWQEEGKSQPEVDVYIFAGDARFGKLNVAGRVFLLSFESYDDKYFFWMQDPNSDRDEAIIKEVLDVINFEDTQMIEEPPLRSPPPSNTSVEGQPRNTAGPAGQNPNSQNNLAELLRQTLQNIQAPRQRPQKDTPSLLEVYKKDVLDRITSDEEAHQRLLHLLPESQQDAQGLRENLRSPQFQQAIEALEHALNSEELPSVLMSLGLEFISSANDGIDALYLSLIHI
eukprot:TRINITY_DN1690_c0_g1_i12.p1 TRINITY_DN1690_c0_g1~~TRINITY_DN1690_c0_g1_i12.p1  ORF type:complete len:274 (+),score=67.02 TRINITY_DN1690_c0_g1_i12:183-1004(+)